MASISVVSLKNLPFSLLDKATILVLTHPDNVDSDDTLDRFTGGKVIQYARRKWDVRIARQRVHMKEAL